MLTCPLPDVTNPWNDDVDTLQETMEAIDTDPELLQALLLRLSQFHGQQPLTEEDWSPAVKSTIAEQDKIGWKALLEGLPSRRWRLTQHQYYTSVASERSSKRWIATLLQQLGKIAWDQWEHRNAIANGEKHPRQLRALQVLHNQIATEYITGADDLPASDRPSSAFH